MLAATTPSQMIEAQNIKIDNLLHELTTIRNSANTISNSENLEALELEVHRVTQELGDTIVSIKIQQHLEQPETKALEKELVKCHLKKNEKHGVS